MNYYLIAAKIVKYVLSRELDAIIERRENRPQPSNRRSATSNHPLQFLSPESKNFRLRNIKGERRYFKKIARRYWEKSKVVLNDKEDEELSRLVNEIESNIQGKEELEKVFEEANESKPGSMARNSGRRY